MKRRIKSLTFFITREMLWYKNGIFLTRLKNLKTMWRKNERGETVSSYLL